MSYKQQLKSIGAKITQAYKQENSKKDQQNKQFEADEEKINELPLFDAMAGRQKKNLHNIKIKVEEQLKNNNEAQKRY